MNAKTTKPVAAPADGPMPIVERVAFEASVALDKQSALARGWNAGNSAAVQAAIAAYNAREAARCERQALALLKL